MLKQQLQGFLNFVREQNFVKLAVAFLLGGAVSKMVTSLVTDIINPVLSIILGSTESLKDLYWTIGDVKVTYGNFLNNFVDFLTIALVIYLALNAIKIDKLDKPKAATPPAAPAESAKKDDSKEGKKPKSYKENNPRAKKIS